MKKNRLNKRDLFQYIGFGIIMLTLISKLILSFTGVTQKMSQLVYHGYDPLGVTIGLVFLALSFLFPKKD
ncbi:hypothetical protein SAMN05216238_11282 [Lentibacillus persicus]|uniref:Uncharacterized protein n=2 Tax=Lentibacillus TaxID=175304 RepID=A0A0U3WCT7_9BACI|nr:MULTISPECIES: hypothetical protein [Lentibacillus]ALX47631.1 hypothetical protein AOX59_02840 [Lentibacillus amyloliquefaciens]SFE30605.1 hypothetical protein SAMN05216238_11282 [Lentibacillus persicus]